MPTEQERADLIGKIEGLPARLGVAIQGLTIHQFDTPHPSDPWTIRQVVHHLADSHMNSFIRMKLIMTEEHPTLKPYDQDAWAKLADTTETPVPVSLALLTALHARWSTLLRNMPEESWSRSGLHPEIGEVTLDDMLMTYARHGEEHLEQLASLKSALGR